jgi:hypothetical protein
MPDQTPAAPHTLGWLDNVMSEMERIMADPILATTEAEYAVEAKRLYQLALAELTAKLPERRGAALQLWSARHQLYRNLRAANYCVPTGEAIVTAARELHHQLPALELPAPPRLRQLIVDLACKTITLDGTIHDVTSDSALRWVKVLAEHPGEWFASNELKRCDHELDGVRTDHLRKFLPDAILTFIDSETGKGSRIRL